MLNSFYNQNAQFSIIDKIVGTAFVYLILLTL